MRREHAQGSLHGPRQSASAKLYGALQRAGEVAPEGGQSKSAHIGTNRSQNRTNEAIADAMSTLQARRRVNPAAFDRLCAGLCNGPGGWRREGRSGQTRATWYERDAYWYERGHRGRNEHARHARGRAGDPFASAALSRYAQARVITAVAREVMAPRKNRVLLPRAATCAAGYAHDLRQLVARARGTSCLRSCVSS